MQNDAIRTWSDGGERRNCAVFFGFCLPGPLPHLSGLESFFGRKGEVVFDTLPLPPSIPLDPLRRAIPQGDRDNSVVAKGESDGIADNVFRLGGLKPGSELRRRPAWRRTRGRQQDQDD